MYRSLFENAGHGYHKRHAAIAAGLILAFCLSGCSMFGGGKDDDASPKGEMRKAEGASSGPKFAAPQYTGKGAPDLASVPDEAPNQPSTKQEREKIIEGLVADRERARHSDRDSRVEPLNVRPLADAAVTEDETPASPPQAKGAPVQSVTKMQSLPGPGATADQLAASASAPPPPPPSEAVPLGPAVPGAAASAPGPRTPAGGTVRSDGFRALDQYPGGNVRNRVAYIDFGFSKVTLTPSDQRKLDNAAALDKEGKGTFRVISRTSDASQKAQQRATAVARGLQNAGVSKDRIYVGVDTGTEGDVEVLLDP